MIRLNLTSDEIESVLFSIRCTVDEMSVDKREESLRKLQEKIRTQASQQDPGNVFFEKKEGW